MRRLSNTRQTWLLKLKTQTTCRNVRSRKSSIEDVRANWKKSTNSRQGSDDPYIAAFCISVQDEHIPLLQIVRLHKIACDTNNRSILESITFANWVKNCESPPWMNTWLMNKLNNQKLTTTFQQSSEQVLTKKTAKTFLLIYIWRGTYACFPTDTFGSYYLTKTYTKWAHS